ncbi:MAG: DUF2079 domain-containing protein [Planctomycetota bacterium]
MTHEVPTPAASDAPKVSILAAVAGGTGIMAFAAALYAVAPLQFQVSSYEVVFAPQPRYWPARFLAVILALFPLRVARRAAMSLPRHRWFYGLSLLWPLLLSAPLAVYAFLPHSPPFALGFLLIAAGGLASLRAVTGGVDRETPRSARPRAHVVALMTLVVLVGVLTWVHTRIQINFFEHFMLGHSDVGHYAEELKNALLGRGLRSDTFANTRLGWHFSPLLYVLVPGYALWPSPKYLMVLGAFVLHVPALIGYYFARRVSGSVAVGFLSALAWLLLPSVGRMIYSNTYGFQWVYVVIPLLAWLMVCVIRQRWRTCWVLIAAVLLCQETTAAMTFGLGLYFLLFSPRRWTGAILAIGSIAYLAVVTQLVIPHFAAAGHYERLELFGQLGGTFTELFQSALAKPELFFRRLLRVEGLYFLLMLLVPMALLPLCRWRMLVMVLPTAALLLLLDNPDWLSIKFWYQATVLPVLFMAGVAALDVGRRSRMTAPGTAVLERFAASSCRLSSSLRWLMTTDRVAPARLCRAGAWTLFICAGWGHYLYGFSPLSKSYEVYRADQTLQRPDPRLAFVEKLRAELPRTNAILATERVAAHFTDYRRLYTGKRPLPANYVIIDRGDRWDPSDLPSRGDEFAADPAYRVLAESGSVVAFERRAEFPLPADPD